MVPNINKNSSTQRRLIFCLLRKLCFMNMDGNVVSTGGLRKEEKKQSFIINTPENSSSPIRILMYFDAIPAFKSKIPLDC